ncbi:MAG: 4a-hydroxytetrahydrobiopterin dehydratase [Bacteroidota bacterium]
MTARLDSVAIAARKRDLPDWTATDAGLQREFTFPSFAEAFGFMAAVAVVAERMDHHPDWSNSWNRVAVRLVSQDVGGVSERDFTLAARMSALYAGFSIPPAA